MFAVWDLGGDADPFVLDIVADGAECLRIEA